jgi:3-hydroxyacyl-[acyl-carrier-protein] dehydratase
MDLVHKPEASVAARVTFDPAHPVYQGHFPGQPVTPGVCIVGMLRDLMQQALKRQLIMSEARMVKFHNPLKPIAGLEVSVNITYRYVDADSFAIKATVRDEEITFCSLNAQYRFEA